MGIEATGPSVNGDGSVTAEATPTATLGAIATTLVSEKPQVQEHAIAQAESDRAAAAGKDKNGNVFNPAIHAVNADGSPRKTVGGAYALKRGKKPNGSANSQTAATPIKGVVVPGAAPGQSAKEQEARAAGAGAANLMFALCVGLGGSEWNPRKDDKNGLDEKLMMESAMGDFFAAHQWGDLPPGLALAAAFAMYAMPRFSMPHTQTRFQKFKTWVGAKIGAWKASRAGKKRGVPESDVERADREARESYKKERANG